MRKNNRAARAAPTLVEFSDVVCANDNVNHNVNTTTKSFILYIKFYGVPTGP